MLRIKNEEICVETRYSQPSENIIKKNKKNMVKQRKATKTPCEATLSLRTNFKTDSRFCSHTVPIHSAPGELEMAKNLDNQEIKSGVIAVIEKQVAASCGKL